VRIARCPRWRGVCKAQYKALTKASTNPSRIGGAGSRQSLGKNPRRQHSPSWYGSVMYAFKHLSITVASKSGASGKSLGTKRMRPDGQARGSSWLAASEVLHSPHSPRVRNIYSRVL